MKKILFALSAIALLLTIASPALNAAGKLDADVMKHLMLGATILWFIVWPASLGMKSE